MDEGPDDPRSGDLETAAGRAPGELSVDALLGTLRTEDAEAAYEAAAALAMIADQQPERLRPHTDALFEVVQARSDLTISAAPGNEAELHIAGPVAEAIGHVAAIDATVLDRLATHLEAADDQTAPRLLRVAHWAGASEPGAASDAYPHPPERFGPLVDAVEQRLEHPRTRAAALDALGGLATRTPDRGAESLPIVLDALEEAETTAPAAEVLVSLSSADPTSLDGEIGHIRERLRTIDPDDEATQYLLTVAQQLAEERPDEIAPIRPRLRELAAARSDGVAAHASEILDVLGGT